jgi:hypothetical protein
MRRREPVPTRATSEPCYDGDQDAAQPASWPPHRASLGTDRALAPTRCRFDAMIGRLTSLAEQLPPTDQQTIGQLFRRIINGLNGLVDRQVQLVKQEIKEDIWAAIMAGKTLGIGIGIAAVGALILLNMVLMMLVLGLNWIGNWLWPGPGNFLGWLVVIVLIAVVFYLAYRFVMRGIREIKISPLDSTRETLSEDISWAKQLLTPNGK